MTAPHRERRGTADEGNSPLSSSSRKEMDRGQGGQPLIVVMCEKKNTDEGDSPSSSWCGKETDEGDSPSSSLSCGKEIDDEGDSPSSSLSCGKETDKEDNPSSSSSCGKETADEDSPSLASSCVERKQTTTRGTAPRHRRVERKQTMTGGTAPRRRHVERKQTRGTAPRRHCHVERNLLFLSCRVSR